MLKILTLSFRNNDGFITKQEMLNTTSKLTAKQVWQNHKLRIKKEPLSDQTRERCFLCIQKVSAVFDRNDKDGDGKLSKEEFKEMMLREKNQQGKDKSREKEKKKT